MTDRERELLTIIRGSRDPAALMLVAAQTIMEGFHIVSNRASGVEIITNI